jgi:hypothetical protein
LLASVAIRRARHSVGSAGRSSVLGDRSAGYQIHAGSSRARVPSTGSGRAESVHTSNRLPTAYRPLGAGAAIARGESTADVSRGACARAAGNAASAATVASTNVDWGITVSSPA